MAKGYLSLNRLGSETGIIHVWRLFWRDVNKRSLNVDLMGIIGHLLSDIEEETSKF